MINKNDAMQVKNNFAHHKNDTGSSEVQVVDLTNKINALSGHAKINPKDHSSKRGLLRMVNLRRKLLEYIKAKSVETYKGLITGLGLRK